MQIPLISLSSPSNARRAEIQTDENASWHPSRDVSPPSSNLFTKQFKAFKILSTSKFKVFVAAKPSTDIGRSESVVCGMSFGAEGLDESHIRPIDNIDERKNILSSNRMLSVFNRLHLTDRSFSIVRSFYILMPIYTRS